MRNIRITFFLVLFFILNFYCSYGQEEAAKDKRVIESEIKFINKKISSSNNKGKLFWLDSLCKVIHFKKEYNYEPIVRQTIKLAIAYDSLNKAAFHTGNLQNYYNNIANEPQKAIVVFDSIFPKLVKSNDSHKASLYLNLGDSYLFTGNIDKATKYYKQAYKYAENAGEEKLKAYSLLYQSEILSKDGDFLKASKYITNASEIFNTLTDTFNIVSAKNSLIYLYDKNGFHKEANKIRTEAIHLAEANHSYGQLSTLYYNKANDEKQSDNYKLKLIYLKKSAIQCKKIKV